MSIFFLVTLFLQLLFERSVEIVLIFIGIWLYVIRIHLCVSSVITMEKALIPGKTMVLNMKLSRYGFRKAFKQIIIVITKTTFCFLSRLVSYNLNLPMRVGTENVLSDNPYPQFGMKIYLPVFTVQLNLL